MSPLRVGPVDGVAMKHLVRHADGRGFFEELLRASDPFFAAGIAQVSWAERSAGTVTAWHLHPTQWDWWFVGHGRLKVVVHDLRRESATFGNTHELTLDGDAGSIIAIPPGVAHGYKVLAGPANILYITSREYNDAHPAPPEGEEGRIPANDASIGYDWENS